MHWLRKLVRVFTVTNTNGKGHVCNLVGLDKENILDGSCPSWADEPDFLDLHFFIRLLNINHIIHRQVFDRITSTLARRYGKHWTFGTGAKFLLEDVSELIEDVIIWWQAWRCLSVLLKSNIRLERVHTQSVSKIWGNFDRLYNTNVRPKLVAVQIGPELRKFWGHLRSECRFPDHLHDARYLSIKDICSVRPGLEQFDWILECSTKNCAKQCISRRYDGNQRMKQYRNEDSWNLKMKRKEEKMLQRVCWKRIEKKFGKKLVFQWN